MTDQFFAPVFHVMGNELTLYGLILDRPRQIILNRWNGLFIFLVTTSLNSKRFRRRNVGQSENENTFH